MEEELAGLLADLELDVAKLGRRALFALSDEQERVAIGQVERVVSMLNGLLASLVDDAARRGVPEAMGFRSAVVWLTQAYRMGQRAARDLVALGAVMDARPALADAVGSGSVSADQARAIGTVSGALAGDGVDAGTVAEAEALLLDQAGSLGSADLSRAGDRILWHVAPDIAEERLRRQLEAAEKRAHLDRGLTFSPERDTQRTRISGYLTAEAAAIVATALEPLAKPRSASGGVSSGGVADGGMASDGVASGGVADDRSAAQRRHDALVEVCRLAAGADQTGRAYRASVERPRLTVTVDYDVLAGTLGDGILDTGQALTPASVRRLACDAGILPAVLGGAGQVLDLGRSARTWTGPAREAIIVRDRGCVFPGCDRPPSLCDVHHCTYYSLGGATDRDNGALLCGFHHYLVHHSGWQVRVATDGRPEVIPPPYVDPDRRPRRNLYHRRN